MKRSHLFVTGLFLSIALYSCRVAYIPPAITVNSNYLVVDGIINSGNTDSTVIKLSRTVPLSGATSTIAETKAKVTVESNANSTTYALIETVKGTYISPGHLNLDKTAQYRLRIITSNGKTYLSDFVVVKEAPPIDSVGYTILANGVQVYANAHDATNSTRYYRYEYVETWAFHSFFSSPYMVQGDSIVLRTSDYDFFDCWQSSNSSDIVLASSAKLTRDVLFQAPVTFVLSSSIKLRIRYSILVKQYALTEDAFNFYQLIETNTQQLGSIFDAQPSQIKGNIHNIADNTEPVFGYISAGAPQQKRIFIDRAALPIPWVQIDPYAACDPIFNTTIEKNFLYPNYNDFFSGSYFPQSQILDDATGAVIGYVGAPSGCANCTLEGTNKKPSFWQ